MKKNELLDLCEEAQNIVDQINKLSYKDKEEDQLISSHLSQLENIEKVLSGDSQAVVARKINPPSKHLLN